jgi:hypothetical protein
MVTIQVDTVRPINTAPKEKFVAVTRLPVTTVPVTVYGWTASDATSGLERYWAQQSTDGSAFSSITLPSPLAPSDRRYLEPEHTYAFRLRAVDRAGYMSTTGPAPTFRLDLEQESEPGYTFSSDWDERDHAYASGGQLRATSAAGAAAIYNFTGTDVGWVAVRGADRGTADVYLDGVLVATVDLYNAALQGRRIVWEAHDLSDGLHTVEIVVGPDKNPASAGFRVDVDAFAVVNPV